ncbi:MAG: DNA methyltransferase [Bacteroides uniformis]
MLWNNNSFKNNNDIILDFFSGSATTAHAVMKLNAEDGGNRNSLWCASRTDRREERSL